MAYDMPCVLEEIIMAEVSVYITAFTGMFISPLPQWLWPPNLRG